MTSTTTISIRPDEGCFLAATRDRTSAMPATVANLGARSITDCEVGGHARYVIVASNGGAGRHPD